LVNSIGIAKPIGAKEIKEREGKHAGDGCFQAAISYRFDLTIEYVKLTIIDLALQSSNGLRLSNRLDEV
jgi:hypothetical protein